MKRFWPWSRQPGRFEQKVPAELRELGEVHGAPLPNTFVPSASPTASSVLPFAQSVADLVVICGRCDKQMEDKGEVHVCPDCGHTEDSQELYDDVSIAGPFIGCEVYSYPDDLAEAKMDREELGE